MRSPSQSIHTKSKKGKSGVLDMPLNENDDSDNSSDSEN